MKVMFILFNGTGRPHRGSPYETNHRNFNRLLACVLVVGLVLTVTHIVSAQREGRRRQRPGQFQRRQMGTEAMIPRMVERMMRDLNLSDKETTVLKPKIENIVQTRMTQSREMRELVEALRQAIESNDNAQIKEKLSLVKTKRKEHEAKIETLEKELVELLTVKQEVQLTILGIVNSDSSDFLFGGRRDGPPGFMGGRRGGPGSRENLIPQFDTDGDGKLNDEERKAARKSVQERMGERRGSRRPAREASETRTSIEDDIKKSSESFHADSKAGLYDDKVLRTLYIRFPKADWYEELGDFYRTDVMVPADLIVDGKVYPSVGVGFRGNSSYMMPSEKKSLNIAIDYGDGKQRLYGYKTLNLLNGHSDASFVRTVLYSRICREYIPALKANFVKLVINGENWGIYPNVQQFNKDFLQEWFGTKRGIRWKIPPGRGGGGALTWQGSDPANYKRAFQLKTKGETNAWADLIKLCEILNKTPDAQLENALKLVFNIDRALWFIALDNVFIDDDGYISRGSDYLLYQHPNGQFQMIPYDNNETFRYAGGGGPNMWPSDEPMLSPVGHEDSEMRPVISRLLAVPHLRARYLAHVRAIVNEWLDWRVLGPIIEEYQSLIDAEVKADDKKLYSYDGFANSATQDYGGGEGFGGPLPGGFDPPSGDVGGRRGGFRRGRRGGPGRRTTPSFKRFVEERREFLLNHPDINKPTPVIKSVSHQSASHSTTPLANETVQVKAEIGGDVKVDAVILYYAAGTEMPFEKVPMKDGGAGDGIYVGEIPRFPAGTNIRYYVEARSVASVGTTTFAPPKTEFGAFTYRITPPVAESSPVVINELMAFNTTSLKDAQGENDDWIELHNVSDKAIDLSGMYLSDNKDNPRKWAFPENTTIPPKGYLIVWADEDGKAIKGLHANFKLAKNGEIVMLIDKDERGNKVLDSIKFGTQKKDVAYGRFPDGTNNFKTLTLTPGKRNEL